MRTRSLNHSTYEIQCHIVWGTKCRRRWLKDCVKRGLVASFKSTVKKYPTLHMVAVNTDQDHVRLQIEIPPNTAVADAVRELKASSSARLRRTLKFIRRICLEKDGIWSVGYFVSSLGLDDGRIKKYIEWQGKRELPQTAKLF